MSHSCDICARPISASHPQVLVRTAHLAISLKYHVDDYGDQIQMLLINCIRIVNFHDHEAMDSLNFYHWCLYFGQLHIRFSVAWFNESNG